MGKHSTKGLGISYPSGLLVEDTMFAVLKTEKFAQLFSFIIGFGIIAIALPVCKGDACFTRKAPSVQEMKESTYRIGSKCYQFKPSIMEYGGTGLSNRYDCPNMELD